MNSGATPQEEGLDKPQASPPGHLPPNSGKFVVPHFEQFAAIMEFASRSYSYQFDEAMRDSRANAIAMRNDPVIMSALRDRQTPSCQVESELDPEDKTDPAQVAAAAKLTKIVERTPKLQQLKRTLLEALFYGRSGVQLTFGWHYTTDDEKLLVIKSWVPVNGDKIVFKFDDTPGILVNAAWFNGSTEPTQRGLAHFLTPDEQECFLCHEFEPEDADFFDGIAAGVVHGIGFRGRLYWYWWMRNNIFSILMDFLQKVGTGFTVFYYEQSNDASMAAVKAAAEQQIGNNVFLFPRNRDRQSAYSGEGIERVEVSMTGANLFTELINLLNGIMRAYIMGETLTTDTGSTGMGSGVAEAHESTAERRTKYDCIDLDGTMQQLVGVLNRWNCPGNPTPRYQSIVDKPNVAEAMQAIEMFYSLGGSLDEDNTRKILGIAETEPGHSILSKVQPMQPAAVNAVPSGTPMAAPAIQDQGQQAAPPEATQEQAPPQATGQPPPGPSSGGDVVPA